MSVFRVCSNEFDEYSLVVADVLADVEKAIAVHPAKVLVFANLGWHGKYIVLRNPRKAGVRTWMEHGVLIIFFQRGGGVLQRSEHLRTSDLQVDIRSVIE